MATPMDTGTAGCDVSDASVERHEQAQLASGDAAVDEIVFKLVFKKETHHVHMSPSRTVAELKKETETLTGVPVSMMKLMFKGLLKDDAKTLAEVGIVKGSKLMVVGSTVSDVLAVTLPVSTTTKPTAASSEKPRTKLCEQEKHKKVIAKGKPEDVLVGIVGQQDSLPMQPLTGMVNNINGKVRLTFKLETDELWIGTKVRTDKMGMSQIQSIVAEPITGHEDYHIMGLQLGPTEQSRYWIYWVPSQYISAIKRTILGHL